MTSRTVLILGANGRFGLAAAEAFAAAGWQVLAQTRRPLAANMPAGVRQIDLPLFATGALADAAHGASVLVYAVNPLYTHWDQVLPMARAGMDLAQRLGARFMLPDNVYNYGETMPALLHEDTPQRPSTEKGRIRCALEAELTARADGSPNALRSTSLRAGDFFGGGRGSWFDQVVVKSLRAGKLTSPGPLDLPHAWAYLPDLARAFVALAEAPGLPDVARFHFAGHTLTNRELLDATEQAARHLGLAGPRPLRRGTMPWGLVRLAGWVLPLWRELATMSYLWRVPHALDGTRLAQTVGPLPATPLDEALQASLRALFDEAARHSSPVGHATTVAAPPSPRTNTPTPPAAVAPVRG